MSRTLSDSRYRVPALALALSGTMALGCAEQDPAESLGTAHQAIASFPDLIVPTGVSLTVNSQIALAVDAKKGDLVLSAAVFDLAALRLNAGDLLMVHQAQGAQIASTDDAGYGAVTSLGGAGQYEVFRVSGSDPVTGQIQIAPGCGLRNNYAALGKTQLVRVPRYHNVTVQTGVNGVAPGTIAASAWNGSFGGVVAFKADKLTLDGSIDASGRGFRGGNSNQGGATNVDQVAYRGSTPTVGAEKGESVAGSQADYDAMSLGGRWGRGAPANGGGGGNKFNSGGGGGANAGPSGAYTGDGVMGNTVMYQAAWMLDPYYVANNAFSLSSGGGRGGYTLSTQQLDPTLVAPGDPAWGSNNRRERGGRGGHPLAFSASSLIFFGGGGGGGDSANNAGGAGGAGGGIVLLLAKNITAAAGGCILADGAPGGNSGPDGAGGGGGGGSVVIATPQLNGAHVDAIGGKGGNSGDAGTAVRGSGGAGGGGFVARPMGLSVQAQVSGGSAGIADTPIMAAFPLDGATDGSAGVVAPYPGLFPVCLPADLTLTVTGSAAMVRVNTPVHYSATVANQGPEDADNVKVTILVPPGTTVVSDPAGDSWTCALVASSYTCSLTNLAIGATAPVLRYILSARPEAPTQIVSTVQAAADNADPVMTNNSGSVSVDIDRTEIHGDGFSCSAAGPRAPTGRAGAAAGFLLAVGTLLLRVRRRASARS